MKSAEEFVLSDLVVIDTMNDFEAESKMTALIRTRDKEIAKEAFEAGYSQGHNDTVESCVRDMSAASEDYLRDPEGGHDERP